MAQYIVSARKYRPDSFESLIGQDNIVQTLKNSVLRGQLAHAYLFCGPRGVGKTSAARIFAKIINCSNPSKAMEPCGQCESCISFQEGRSYCIHELDAASNNGVDDIKALIDQVNIPPQIGRYSVFIVDEVHMLSQAAFNAFLKTLEEPPAHAIFILATTEKHKILPTILSRCQTYDFNRISIPDIVRNLRDIAGKEGITIDDESLHIIAQKADGAMRDALTIFDQTVAFCGTDVKSEDVMRNLNVLDYEHCFHLVNCFLSGDYSSALMKFDEILSRGFNALHFISALSSHLRDLLVARSNGLDALLELPESLKAKYKEQAGRCSIPFLYEALNITTQCESGYRASVNPRLHIEFALMKLSFINNQPAKPVVNQAPQPMQQPASQQKPVSAPVQQPAQVQQPVVLEKAVQEQKPEPATDSKMVQNPEPQIQQSVSPKTEPSPMPQQPEMSDSETPKTPARGRKRAVKSPSSLSISSIAEGGFPEQVKETSMVQDNDSIPSDEVVLKCWHELPKEYASRPRLATTLETAKVSFEEKDDRKFVTFFVINIAQQQWLQEKLLSELEVKLQRMVGSSKVKLLVEVTEEELVEKKPYVPKDQAIELMNTNPEVMNLVKDLDLDTKF